MKIITDISRVLVGSLLVVSGVVKAVDPIGFSYKLEEYFMEDALNWSWFSGAELGLGMAMCIAEIVLGIALLLGARARLTAWGLLLMMMFFTFLTGYTAIGNWFFDNPESATTHWFEGLFGFTAREDVHYFKDCGCFGDAIKLEPWHSFLKDVILLVLTLVIFFRSKTIQPNNSKQMAWIITASAVIIAAFSFGQLKWGFPFYFFLVLMVVSLAINRYLKVKSRDWISAAMVVLLSFVFTWYCYQHLPIKDFRPYAVGKSIVEGRAIPKDAPLDVYETVLTYQNSTTNEIKEFSSENYPWEDSTWVWVSTDNKLIKKGYEPSIHDFDLTGPDGNEYTDDILSEPCVFLLITYDITRACEDVQQDINKFVESAGTAGYYTFGLTAALYDDLEEFRHKHQSMYDFYTADGTMLKTVIRSNPGLVMLREGRVTGKWHYNDFPKFEEIQKAFKL